MLKQEFEERTQLTVTEQEFDQINDIYMASSLEKDAFCAEWLKEGHGNLIFDILDKLTNCRLVKDLYQEDAERLIDAYITGDEVEIDEAMRNVHGHAYVIRRKLELDSELTPADLTYIKENLR